MNRNNIAVIGAGSWGTAIAGVLSLKCPSVTLWGRNKEHTDSIKKSRENTLYLPGFTLNKNISITSKLQKALHSTDIVIMVVPSQGYREVFKEVIQIVQSPAVVVSAVKGIENKTLATMTEVMRDELQHSQKKIDISVLSGPSFAKEVADKIPTAVTIGAEKIDLARKLQKLFVTDFFRVYASQDVIGLEISAAFKNIIAIATGICDGLGYGLNTRAALITRGLAEITRIGMKMGADPLTFSGLSGMGDLILTCTGDLSRNRHVGLELGKGKKINTILQEMKMVAEGVKTAQSGYNLAQKQGIEMPILEQVYQIIYRDKNCSAAVKELLSRELKIE